MLLDTHVLLWLLTASPRLGATATDAVRAAPQVYVSAVSVVEIRIKQMLGRLVVPDDFSARLDAQGLRELPLGATHADGLSAYPALTPHDPFDRLLVAQAAIERLSLLTADTRLLGLGLPFVVDASA